MSSCDAPLGQLRSQRRFERPFAVRMQLSFFRSNVFLVSAENSLHAFDCFAAKRFCRCRSNDDFLVPWAVDVAENTPCDQEVMGLKTVRRLAFACLYFSFVCPLIMCNISNFCKKCLAVKLGVNQSRCVRNRLKILGYYFKSRKITSLLQRMHNEGHIVVAREPRPSIYQWWRDSRGISF